MASPSSVLSLGFGSWGSTSLVVTLGFGIGGADPAPYAEPELIINRLHPRTQTISRKFAQTQSIGRLHPRTVEVTSE